MPRESRASGPAESNDRMVSVGPLPAVATDSHEIGVGGNAHAGRTDGGNPDVPSGGECLRQSFGELFDPAPRKSIDPGPIRSRSRRLHLRPGTEWRQGEAEVAEKEEALSSKLANSSPPTQRRPSNPETGS